MDQYIPPNILFYSKQCPHCKKFAELLFKLPQINDKFVKISVDVRSQRLPSFVKRVPTIVVHDQGERQVLNDANVFGWINQYLKKTNKVNLVPYDQGGMSSSLSDGFSFLGEKEGQEAEHTFAWMDKMQDTRIGLVADGSDGPTTGSQVSKISEGQLERYMTNRDRDIPRAQKPQQDIDFTKLYEQESGGAQTNNSVVSQLKQFRQRQVRKGPPPRNAPNFQSKGFNAPNFQSPRGGTINNFGGGGSRGNPKQQEMDNKMNKLMSQRDRENGSFQQRQTGEYMPLNINQQRVSAQQQRTQSQNHQIGGRRMPGQIRNV